MDENNAQIVDADLCFGCGVCATGCPEGAISMEAKADFPVPPKTVKELAEAFKTSAGAAAVHHVPAKRPEP